MVYLRPRKMGLSMGRKETINQRMENERKCSKYITIETCKGQKKEKKQLHLRVSISLYSKETL